MSILICPKCGEKLLPDGNTMHCKNTHCYDISKEGYVNLLLTTKSGDRIGDSRDSAHARRELLSKGYYKCLQNTITEVMQGTVLDICCGEGYYDQYNGELYGFDISKEMVRLAAKSHPGNHYFVANLAAIPIADASIDTAIHLFAPFNEREFTRVLRNGATLYSVIPGAEHLYEMKQILYDTPYKNDEQPPATDALELCGMQRVKDRFEIGGTDLKKLFAMTPYYYHTPKEFAQRLNRIDSMDLTVDFIILKYKKRREI